MGIPFLVDYHTGIPMNYNRQMFQYTTLQNKNYGELCWKSVSGLCRYYKKSYLDCV